jgi:DNA-binding XRE family transcriptional regulator
MSRLRRGGVGSDRPHRGSPAGPDGTRGHRPCPFLDSAVRRTAPTQWVQPVLGRVLRAARERRGLSQEDLAAAAGLDRTYPSLIERGLRAPRLSTFIHLCEAVGVSPARVLRLLTRPAKPRSGGWDEVELRRSRGKRP